MQQKGNYIMNEVIARIDISTPTGRRVVRELEKHKKIVKMEYPLLERITDETYTLDEVHERGLNTLSEHYGVDMRKLMATIQ